MSPDLFALISRHELDEGDRGAVGTSDLQVTLSYRQLVALVHSAASQPARVGLHRDDVVAMVTDNSIESVIGLLAVVSSGGAVAPLDPALTTAEVDARCAAASVRARLVGAQNADQIGRSQDVAGGLDRWTIAVAGSGESMTVEVSRANDADEKGQGAARSGGHAIVDDVALVLFTAGSTSAPKAVPLTHQNLVASINGIVTTYELAPTDATLVVMPLFHGHGLVAGLLATLVSGGTAYLPSTGEFSAHLFWADMARTGATWYTAVPTIHRILVDRAPQEYPSDAPVPLRFIRSCERAARPRPCRRVDHGLSRPRHRCLRHDRDGTPDHIQPAPVEGSRQGSVRRPSDRRRTPHRQRRRRRDRRWGRQHRWRDLGTRRGRSRRLPERRRHGLLTRTAGSAPATSAGQTTTAISSSPGDERTSSTAAARRSHPTTSMQPCCRTRRSSSRRRSASPTPSTASRSSLQ